ncbi:hypothetical protein ACWFQE_01280, partial [Streptomyces bacillaris]
PVGTARPGGGPHPPRPPPPPRGVRAAAPPRDELFRFLLTLTAGSLDPHEALSLWEREERPQRERYGVTVADGRQWAWLDDPEGPYTWPLGGLVPFGPGGSGPDGP